MTTDAQGMPSLAVTVVTTTSLQTQPPSQPASSVLSTQQILSEFGSLTASTEIVSSLPLSLSLSVSTSMAASTQPISSVSPSVTPSGLRPETIPVPELTSVATPLPFSTQSFPPPSSSSASAVSTPAESPLPLRCPSLLRDGEEVPPSSLVQLRLGLTVSKHSLISQPNTFERCELEGALANAVFGEESVSLVAKRQTHGGSGYDADVSTV